MTLGDYRPGDTIDFKFTTIRASSGAPFTLAGTPAVSVYKANDGTETTTGVTLTVDFDSRTGLNHVRIVTSDAFYASGENYDVVITTGTVDSVSAVGFVVGRFSLGKTSCLKPTTAGRTLDVSAGGEAGIDFANIGSPTTTVNLSGTTIAAVTGAVGSVTARVTANTDQLAGQTVTAANAVVFPSTVSSLTAAGVRSELQVELGRIDVDISSRLATSSYTTPPTSAAIADAVWDEATTGHTTAGTYGGQVLRGANSNVEVQVTGSNHVAADMHESQPGSIHAATFDTGAIDAAALATDAVAEIVSGVLTTQMTESYRATNAAPTLAQAAFELIAHMGEASISSTTKTLKKLDGSTTAKTYTLDSATTPTSITEAT